MKKHKGFREIMRKQIEPLYMDALDKTNNSFVFPNGKEIKYSDFLMHYQPAEYEKGFFNYCTANEIMVVEFEWADDKSKHYQFFEKE